MEQIPLEAISRHKKKKMTGKSQHRFIKDKSCLTNLIAFCDKMTRFVEEGRTAHVIDFSKALGTTSHSILVPKLRCYDSDSGTTGWVEKLDGSSGSKDIG